MIITVTMLLHSNSNHVCVHVHTQAHCYAVLLLTAFLFQIWSLLTISCTHMPQEF